MVEQANKVWVDGALLDWQQGSQVSLLTHTLHYGVGAFEGIRAYQRTQGETIVFRLREHVARLFDSCRLAMLSPGVDLDQVIMGCVDLLRQSQMKEAYLRPLCLLSAGAMGLFPADNPVRTYIMAWKWGAYLGADGLANGVRCKISSYARHHVNASFCKAKLTGQYTNSVMAKREVRFAGYDEALMLDVDGYVAEGSGENIFIIKDGVLKTPPTSSPILAGITRDTLLTLAREEGMPVVEERFSRDELFLADEIFLTGTAAEVTPVREVDDRVVGAGRMGDLTKILQQRYFAVVRGADTSHPEWVTLV
jgi:branched-chain amino acid aminotransferase